MRFASFVFWLLVGLFVTTGLPTRAYADGWPPIAPSFLMDQEPAERAQEVVIDLHPQLLPLWKLAIQHPESDMQRQAAEAVATAHRMGHKGLSDFASDLTKLLKNEQAHPSVRLSAARALITLDHRDAAAGLYEVSLRDGQLMRQIVEPALAQWAFTPIQTVWLERIKSPATPRRELLLAMNGLATQQVTTASGDLLKIVNTKSLSSDIRFAAARCAGEITSSGLESESRTLYGEGQQALTSRLCAAALLSTHRSPEAIELNQKMAIDEEPAVAGIALRALFAADPQLVLPVAEASLNNRDANVRRVAIETYLQLPTVERMQSLANRLNDHHPTLRGLVRDGFFTHSRNPALETVIREQSVQVLAGNDWRGQEQASLLLAALDRKEITPRLIELLKSDRDEVMIASAWALRILAVPETAPALVEQIRVQSGRVTLTLRGAEHQVAHLSEALAIFKYVPAIPVLSIYVPKSDQYSPVSRSAAVWALGHILEDAAAGEAAPAKELSLLEKAAQAAGLQEKPQAEVVENLAAQLMGRIQDVNGMPPEAPEVRRTSALTLGRMKARSQLDPLQAMIGDKVDNDSVEIAMRWAVLRITGQSPDEMPISPPDRELSVGWFLEPAPTSLKETAPAAAPQPQ